MAETTIARAGAQAGHPRSRPRRSELSAIAVIAHRDFIKLLRDRTRLFSELAFPLVLVLLLGPQGRIADAPRGDGGFGYDPVFVPDGEKRTIGELGDEWKAQQSHRARSAQALREALDGSGLAVP